MDTGERGEVHTTPTLADVRALGFLTDCGEIEASQALLDAVVVFASGNLHLEPRRNSYPLTFQ